MKKMMIPALTIALLGPSSGFAQGGQEQGLYIGGNYGGYKARGGDFDDENDLYEGLVGVQVSPYLAIEANYTDFGSYGSSSASAEVDGLGAALVGQLPLTDSLALYAKGGWFWWDGDVEVLGVRREFDDDTPFYGAGVRFRVSDALGLNVEYKRYEIEFDGGAFPLPPRADDTDLDTLTLGLRYSF